jgi:LytS/YehU family sensor histidine kinase
MYFVVPKLLLKNKYIFTFVSVIILFLLTASISAFIGIYILKDIGKFLLGDNFYGDDSGVKQMSFFRSLLAGLRGGITIGGMAAAIKLMKILYLKEQRNLQLQKENTESQLQLLKAQVHPHFLFNTLNNIYCYTQNVSPVASKLVLGLSDLLRSILYECNKDYIAVEKEIKMIKNYITLEKIRYGNKLDISMNISEDDTGLQIAPLLLLPFVENCFKHGASQVIDQPWLSIYLDFDEDNMYMKLINGKSLNNVKSHFYSGIGLDNVRRRLEMLYAGKFLLEIKDEEEVFIVELKLQLQKIKQRDITIPIPEKIMSYG